jgi:hypothetical protein
MLSQWLHSRSSRARVLTWNLAPNIMPFNIHPSKLKSSVRDWSSQEVLSGSISLGSKQCTCVSCSWRDICFPKSRQYRERSEAWWAAWHSDQDFVSTRATTYDDSQTTDNRYSVKEAQVQMRDGKGRRKKGLLTRLRASVSIQEWEEPYPTNR